MNAPDILFFGNNTIHGYIDDLSEAEWEAAGVCGWWSVKEIVAHLASFEHVLSEVIRTVEGDDAGPYMASFAKSGQEFNDIQVEERQSLSYQKVLAEYESQLDQNIELVKEMTPELCRLPGTLPWYGNQYSLDDFVVYTFYGHKREHGAQIGVYRDKIGR